MKSKTLTIIALCFIQAGCRFPSRQAVLLEGDALTGGVMLENASKAFLKDGSVIVFPDGLRTIAIGDTGTGSPKYVTGSGYRVPLNGNRSATGTMLVRMDSIAAMTTYNEKVESPATAIAGSLLFLSALTLAPYSVYCASCPKCCFGSCPTVYTWDGEAFAYETELFSYSISKQMEQPDLDVLNGKPGPDGRVTLRVANEAMETHLINQFALVAAHHPRGTRVFPTPDGKIIAMAAFEKPLGAVNRKGEDVLAQLEEADDTYYRSGPEKVKNATVEDHADWIDLTVPTNPGSASAGIVIRMRNSLLNTVLLYDVVLRSQGVAALAWTDRMNNDAAYAGAFMAVYRSYSGVRVSTVENGAQTMVSSISDVGPVGWKDVAVRIPVNSARKQMHVRLEFFPDNVMIDRIAIDPGIPDDSLISLAEIPPESIIDGWGTPRPDIPALLRDDDDRYLVTSAGQSFRLSYAVSQVNDREVTLFVTSKGYYNEWIRGGWLAAPHSGYAFSLLDLRGTLSELSRQWELERETYEHEFFKNRIALQEAP